ncbi:hypothetical protein [Saccharothrix sp. HUAS TT1]|uniref:alginate O-acetyltransferase AlgX-related protein n=1 Tax=unclassified Saccharothrix TaxID=2593673 RepID=UPI00345B72B0
MSVDPPKSLPAVPESLLPREHAFYRPRHSERQRGALVAAVVFFCTPLLLLVVGVRPGEFENRKLAEFPAITQGWDFFVGLDRWATDHLPLRQQAVIAADGISRGVFGEPPKLKRETKVDGPVQLPAPPPTTTSAPQDRDAPMPSDFPDVIEGRRGWLYLGQDVRGACEPAMALDDVFARLRALRTAVESSGRKFVLVVAPNKSTMVPENLPTRYYGADCAAPRREEFWNRLSAETGALDLRPGLRAAAQKAGGPVYSRLDTHWNHDGGLVYTRALVEQIRPGATAGWKVEKGDVVDVPADLPRLLGRTESERVQTYTVAPDGKRSRSRAVDRPLEEPKRFVQLPGTGMVNTQVGMLGDSFSMHVLRDLVAPFSDLTLQDSDQLPKDPRRVADMLAGKDVVVVEASERSLVAGVHPLLDQDVLGTITAELAARPK